MAPHLTKAELDMVAKMKHLPTSEILNRVAKSRERRGVAAPGLHVVQRVVKGSTFNRGVAETRGRKKKLSPKNVRQLNTARKLLIKNAKGEQEIHWKDIIHKARVPTVHPSTARRALKEAGVQVEARKPRAKPMRTREHEAERMALCKKWARRSKQSIGNT
jgi:hypothetical protein